MKKKYVRPEISVHEFNVKSQILAGSQSDNADASINTDPFEDEEEDDYSYGYISNVNLWED